MNSRSTITLSNTDYKIGFSFQAIKLYEELTGRSIQETKTTWDNLQYCYCSIKALNPDFKLTLDEFVDLLDENPQLLIDIQFATNQNDPVPEPVEATKKKTQLLKLFFVCWTLSVLLLVSPVAIPIIFGSIWIFGSLKYWFRRIAKSGKKPAL